MFYSQTFLARKGPLGTVWCAAHLQHRLKKSHYTSTDIRSTVDRIMFPEVPIALRLSGHLLLGVVRIYSKQVDYLFNDCKVVLTGLTKAFASIELTLPEDALQAPIQSITLPDTFDLDALDLDYDMEAQDNHLRSPEDITLTDQIHIGGDPYIAISFDEDIVAGSSELVQSSDSGVRPMEEDTLSQRQVNVSMDFQDPGSSNGTEIFNERFIEEENPPQNFGVNEELPRSAVPESSLNNQTELIHETNDMGLSPTNGLEIETLREAVSDSSLANPLSPASKNGMAEPERPIDETTNLMGHLSPIMEDNLTSQRSPLSFPPSVPPPSSASQGAPDMMDVHFSLGRSPPELVLRSSPPHAPQPVQQPKARPRKRKQFFDESTVLTNKFMKKALENSSDLLRERRNIPRSALGVWRFANSLRKEQVFLQPTTTGMCSDLCNVFDKDYIVTKKTRLICRGEVASNTSPRRTPPHNKALPDERVAQSPPSSPLVEFQRSPAPTTMPDFDMEMENLRHVEGNDGTNILSDLITSPSKLIPSPRGDGLSPLPSQTIRSPSVGNSTAIGSLPMPDQSASVGHYESEFETPRTFFDERMDAENLGLFDIPESGNSAEPEELYFLEADSDSTIGSQGQGTHGVDSLSVRTRAVAKYLKEQSPITLSSEDHSRGISLHKILDGKKRKQCARMFFETLVLKSYGLIDVQQDTPYGDIILKLTPTLSKSQI